MSLLTWTEYVAPELLEKFEQEAGVQVAVTEVENSERLLQELADSPSSFDVVVADQATVSRLVDLRLLRELDPRPLGREAPMVRSWPGPGDAAGHCVPYLWGLTVLAGRSEILDGAEASWDIIWREDLRVSVLDEPSDLIWIALLAMGRDPARASEADLEEAADRLGERFPDLRDAMRDSVSAVDALARGELDLVMAYNGDALLRALDDPGLKVVIPREGAPLWMDGFTVSRDSPSPELAGRFIRFMSTAEAAARSASELLYATPWAEALELVDPSLLSIPALYPPAGVMEKCVPISFSADQERYLSRALVRLLRGDRLQAVSGAPSCEEFLGDERGRDWPGLAEIPSPAPAGRREEGGRE